MLNLATLLMHVGSELMRAMWCVSHDQLTLTIETGLPALLLCGKSFYSAMASNGDQSTLLSIMIPVSKKAPAVSSPLGHRATVKFFNQRSLAIGPLVI